MNGMQLRAMCRFDGDSESEADDDLDTEDVFQLPDSDDEIGDSEEDEDDSEEDIKERNFQEIEDELREKDQAWGKKKSTYYNDDEDEELSSAAEEEMEEEEEKEAMVLQKRLLSHLSDDHFDTQRFISDTKETAEKETIVRTDFENMTKDEKLIYLLQNSPELPEMLEEFREKLSEAREPLYPLLQLGRQQGTFSHTGHSYIEAKYKLNLLYCLNIGFYLMLQSSDKSDTVKNHPVIQRIVDLRKIFKTCAETDFTLEKEIEHLLNVKQSDEEIETKKKRKISSDENKSGDNNEEDLYEKQLRISQEKKRKKKKKTKGIEVSTEDPTLMDEEEEKRGITFKIMKNKGLTPHRKKEQRNPRVKHRKKFDKALKKRRSQVPDFRDHEGTYGGEKSGIKSNLTKSTKLR
ncbi:hypothetical protein ACHWQZ_G014990 [Mnemiopsis leidyi]